LDVAAFISPLINTTKAMKRGTFILSLALLVIAFAGLCTANRHRDGVHLSDVQTLTLREGARTEARRSSPVPQLKCLSDSKLRAYAPSVVQCINRGTDDSGEVQWKCEADLDKKVRFGRMDVTCEGYDSSADPMVLRGSCGLEYELEWTSVGQASQRDSRPTYQRETLGTTYSTGGGNTWVSSIISWVVVSLIGWVCLVQECRAHRL
jgi:hypothetical protein